MNGISTKLGLGSPPRFSSTWMVSALILDQGPAGAGASPGMLRARQTGTIQWGVIKIRSGYSLMGYDIYIYYKYMYMYNPMYSVIS